MKVLAQITNPVLPESIGKGSIDQGVKAFGTIISGTIGAFFFFSFIITFIYLLLGGVQWITSAGDKSSLEAARNKITHAIVGIVIVGAAWAIFVLITTWFGVGGSSLKIPTITP
jgi:hypothetical protein